MNNNILLLAARVLLAFMFIMAGVVAMFGVISYVTSIVMQAREYAAAAAEAEARAAPVQPKLIKLDSTAQP